MKYIQQCCSYTSRPLAEAKLLTHSFISILMSFLAHRGKSGGRQGHKLPNFLFHFKTFHKGSKNMPKNRHISKLVRCWLPNVYSFRKMFISLPSFFSVSQPPGWTLSGADLTDLTLKHFKHCKDKTLQRVKRNLKIIPVHFLIPLDSQKVFFYWTRGFSINSKCTQLQFFMDLCPSRKIKDIFVLAHVTL